MEVLSILDLADMIALMGYDKQIITKILQDELRDNGDDGIMNTFKEICHLDLNILTHGRYVIKQSHHEHE